MALSRYAELRGTLHSFYSVTEPLSIPAQLHNLAWMHLTCVAAHRIAFAAQQTRQASVFDNPLLRDYLWTGALASQLLAISRLLDSRKDVIALPRLLNNLDQNQAGITREAYVTCDGVPYDAEPAASALLAAGHEGFKDKDGIWFFADAATGQRLWGPRASQMRQRRFDVWSGRSMEERQPYDVIGPRVFEVLKRELNQLKCSNIVWARHKFIAHSADAPSRSPDQLKQPGATATRIDERQLRRAMALTFSLARILGEILLQHAYSGPIGGLSGPETYIRGLHAAPMSNAAAARIGRLPSAMRRLFARMECAEMRRIEGQFRGAE